MAVKTYSLKKDGNTMLSAHFAVKEFKSGDGADTILIDTALIDMLEKLFAKLNCGKIIITSGYRTAAYDKKVGGSGSGYHTSGHAADVNCYMPDGKTRYHGRDICTALQELNASGIGWIAGCAVHIDTRTSRYWFDEQKNCRSIGNDWYAYFGISRPAAVSPAVPAPAPTAPAKTTAATAPAIAVGDKVRFKTTATHYRKNGGTVPAWAKPKTHVATLMKTIDGETCVRLNDSLSGGGINSFAAVSNLEKV